MPRALVTVDALIKILTKVAEEGHGDDVVVMSRDAEGNGFSAFEEIGADSFEDDQPWYSIEMYHKPEDDEDDEPREEPGNLIRAIVFWPF